MLMYAVAVLLACVASGSSREALRPMPTITNSLVNLGKMEIAFYFNGNGRDSSAPLSGNAPFLFPKSEPLNDEQCPCSSLRNVKDSFLTNPTGLLNKILMSNDLFSSNKEPLTSSLCCDSHEHLQEGTVVLEFPSPKNTKPLGVRNNPMPSNVVTVPNSAVPMPLIPFLFDSIIPNKSMLPPMKTKSIEIFLFPKKKEGGGFEFPKLPLKKKDNNNIVNKDKIHVVGDKDLKNDINLFTPPTPVVKKDLNLQEKNEKQRELEKENQEIEKEKQEFEREKQELEKAKQDMEKEVDQILMEPANKPNAL